MTYTGSDKIVYIVDQTGKKEKTSAHVTFDEAHMTTSPQHKPPLFTALQQAGHRQHVLPSNSKPSIIVKSLSKDSTTPTKATPGSAGYDLYSPQTITIRANSLLKLPLGLCMEIPPLHYGQIKSRSGLCVKHRINAQAGVIDSDYRGEVAVTLVNESEDDYTITKGDRIAQLILLQVPDSSITTSSTLTSTQRNTGGFGSTDTTTTLSPSTSSTPKSPSTSTSMSSSSVNNKTTSLPLPLHKKTSLPPSSTSISSQTKPPDKPSYCIKTWSRTDPCTNHFKSRRTIMG